MPTFATAPTWRQKLLGIFILVQLAFLVLANWFWFLRYRAPNPAIDVAAYPVDRYAELTGQVQGWAQYSPNVTHQTAFPAVEVRWDDDKPGAPGSRLFRAKREPANPYHYTQSFGNRLGCYEAALTLPMWTWDEVEAQKEPEVWRARLRSHIRRYWRMILAYLFWLPANSGDALDSGREDPNHYRPIGQYILWARLYPASTPQEGCTCWHGPIAVPMARFHARADRTPGTLLIDMYDPFTHTFVEVPEHGD